MWKENEDYSTNNQGYAPFNIQEALALFEWEQKIKEDALDFLLEEHSKETT